MLIKRMKAITAYVKHMFMVEVNIDLEFNEYTHLSACKRVPDRYLAEQCRASSLKPYGFSNCNV